MTFITGFTCLVAAGAERRAFVGGPKFKNGFSSVGRALVSKTRCREFESLNPCKETKGNDRERREVYPEPSRGESLNPCKERNNTHTMVDYIKESYNELRNHVSWPTWAEAQRLTVIVAVFSIILALAVFGVDKVFSNIIELYFNWIKS